MSEVTLENIDKFELPFKYRVGDFEQKEEQASKPIYFIYPKFRELQKEHKQPVVPDLNDVALTQFLETVDKTTIRKKITAMVRLKAVDENDPKRKRKEFLIWYETWEGEDANGNIIPSMADYPVGVEKKQRYAKEGTAENFKWKPVGAEYFVYSIPFDKKRIEKAIEAASETDSETVSYSLVGSKSWGGFSFDEFINLSFEELNVRGQTGKVGYPVSVKVDKGARAE